MENADLNIQEKTLKEIDLSLIMIYSALFDFQHLIFNSTQLIRN